LDENATAAIASPKTINAATANIIRLFILVTSIISENKNTFPGANCVPGRVFERTYAHLNSEHAVMDEKPLTIDEMGTIGLEHRRTIDHRSLSPFNDQFGWYGRGLLLDPLDLSGFVKNSRQEPAAFDRIIARSQSNFERVNRARFVAMRGFFRQRAKFRTFRSTVDLFAAEQKNGTTQPDRHKTCEKPMSSLF
jgi:hypothetical protein